MLPDAHRHDAPLERLSFKGSVDACAPVSRTAISQAKTKAKAARLVRELLRVLLADLVPHRPGRQEPRAVKRRPKPYSLLTKPRHQFAEIPHRGKYRAAARH